MNPYLKGKVYLKCFLDGGKLGSFEEFCWMKESGHVENQPHKGWGGFVRHTTCVCIGPCMPSSRIALSFLGMARDVGSQVEATQNSKKIDAIWVSVPSQPFPSVRFCFALVTW